MGRVLKNSVLNSDVYVVSVPQLAASSTNGHVEHFDDVFSNDLLDQELPVFEPAAPETQPIDWEALHHEAAALIDGATADARAVLESSRSTAREMISTANTHVEAIRDAAHTEGASAGHAEGVEIAERDMDEMLLTMRGLVDMARVERHKIVEGAEPEIVRLAMGIAERIIHQRIETDPKVVVEMTRAAIARLVDRESVTVRVNPADLEQMREHREDVLALGESKHMRIIEDQRVDRGGVIVETESGSLDAKISTQIAEARRVLHLDDEVVITPAPQSPLRAAATV